MKQTDPAIERQLASVILRNPGVKISTGDDENSVLIEVDLKYPGFKGVLSKFLPVRSRRRFQLEGIGLDVYKMIDGKKTFEELIDEFAGMHKLTFFEARGFLMEYVRSLAQRGLVVIGVKRREK